jgi:hypothetical protein
MMPADFEIPAFLAEVGYTDEDSQAVARAILELAGLTRAGKSRMAGEKRERALEALDAALVRACAAPACIRRAEQLGAGKAIVEVPAEACPSCKGSDNRRAMAELAARLPGLGVSHLLVLGGTPVLHAKMAELLRREGSPLELRYVDGTSAVFTRDDANHVLRWADAVAVWASTPLPHKVSTLFTDAQAARDGVPVVTVTQRGIAGFCQQLLASFKAQPRKRKL